MMKQDGQRTLEELYELPEQYLRPDAAARLEPALLYGMERTSGEDRLLKVWWKIRGDIGEIRELWRHEQRQVTRVMAYPGADRVMVNLVRMEETADAFCAVYETGFTPVAVKLKSLNAGHWLKRLDTPRNRMTLWRNIARIGEALGIIHAQNLIHGRLDGDSIFTEGASEPDFRLGGFEWSVGVSDEHPHAPELQQVRTRLDRLIYSYADDWRALGAFCARLLGLDPDKIRSEEPYLADFAEFELVDGEFELLRRIIDPAPGEVLDGRSIGVAVESLNREIGAASLGSGVRLLLNLSLSQSISETIEELTGGAVSVDDSEAQLEHIRADIAAGARIGVATDGRTVDTLYLMTDRLVYQLRAFQAEDGETWQAAFVRNVSRPENAKLPGSREVFRVVQRIELLRNRRDVSKRLTELRRQAVDWSSLVSAPTTESASDGRTLRRAMLLVQTVEAMLKAVDVLPVRIVGRDASTGRTRLKVTARSGQRDALLKPAGEKPTAEVLHRIFEEEDRGSNGGWLLTASGSLSAGRGETAEVRFIEASRDEQSGEQIYEFETKDIPPTRAEVFLREGGDAGTEALIKRRLRTSRALEHQTDLVNFFVDPRLRLRDSGDVLEEDEQYADLDDPKQKALKRLWTTRPNHIVIGPPGVGKTRLSAELVRRHLDVDPSSRILLSAQSHQALDHLLNTVKPQVADASPDAIVVRSRGNENTVSTDADVRQIARSYLDRAIGSDLFKTAPEALQAGMTSLKTAVDQAEELDKHLTGQEAMGFQALNALILESANVVFSTTNSGDVESLVEDGAQFDWVIIEEGAKASGPDLVAPLALAARRLLIGDHNQLPPFDALRLGAVLSNRTALLDAMNGAMVELLSGVLFDSGFDDLRAALKDEDEFETVVGAAQRLIEPFKTFVGEEEQRQKRGASRQVVSSLLVQHRMDPAIAELVSNCFYDKKLLTDDARAQKATAPLPFEIDGLPASPIVFIDLPAAARSGKAQPAEFGRPRWHNPEEVRVVRWLVDHLRSVDANADKPSLAVLTPYTAQLDRIRSNLAPVLAGDHLTDFEAFGHGDRFLGTVDSAQGSEADLVIISFVRNNHRSGKAALGFLSDPRRMNVLLSRAKKQLVIVGSQEFLKEATRQVKDDKTAFMRLFLSNLQTMTRQPSKRGPPKATILSWADLKKGSSR